MNKIKMSEQFNKFLQEHNMDIHKYEYISKDCTDYKVRNIETGVVGYIRY
jgi:hypothetical protein